MLPVMKTIRPGFAAAFVAGALLVAGCTPTLDIAVDGYAAPGAPATTRYALVPADPRVSENDLQFATLSAELEHVLAARGWTRVAGRKDAATLVRFGHAVSGPINDIREYDRPEFGVTGYYMARNTAPGPNGTVVSSATMVPVYGQTGYTRTLDARILYATSAYVEASDLAKDKDNPPQLWKTTITTTDSTGDARSLLPVMLRAAAPYLGTDTGGLRHVTVEDKREAR